MKQFARAVNDDVSNFSEHDWFDVSRYAIEHGLGGLLLNSSGAKHVPQWVNTLLRVSIQQVGERNLHLMGELDRVAGTFGRAGIPLMALKGAALNLTLYNRGTLRPMGDIDLLVHPRHALRAVDVLQGLGYGGGAALLRDDFFPQFHYERELILPGRRPVRIDLHAHPWRPMHLSQIVSGDDFWRDARRTYVGSSALWVPSAETMFVHLAAHAAFHGCSRFIWLYDLKQLVSNEGDRLDWSAIQHQACKWQLTSAIRAALDTAQSVFGPLVPETVTNELGMLRAAWRDRFSLWHTPRDAARPLLHVVCNTIGLRGVRPKIEYLRAMLTPNLRHLGEAYPFRHWGWPACAHLWRVLRNMGRAVTAGLIPARRLIRAVGAYA